MRARKPIILRCPLWSALGLTLLSACAPEPGDGQPDAAGDLGADACTADPCPSGDAADTCSEDCSAEPVCGDDRCDAGESDESCEQDCAGTAECGDGACSLVESWASCPDDCSCGNAFCGADETLEDCPDDCPAACGNGDCDPDETRANCPADCDLGAFYCADGDPHIDAARICDGDEDCANGSDESPHAWMCDGTAQCSDDTDLLTCTDCAGTEWSRSCTGITVELVWTTPGDATPSDTAGADLDLLFRHPFGQSWSEECLPTRCGAEAPWVCSRAYPQPNWGDVDNLADNPNHLGDDTDGWGPETIILPEPEGDARVYSVGVRYHDDHGFGTSLATVTVFVDHVAVARWSGQAMEAGDFWYVADVSWPSQSVATIDALYPAVPREICDNGMDDDADGASDCSDTDCGRNPVCPLDCWLWEDDPGWTVADGFQAVVISANAELVEPVALAFAPPPLGVGRPLLWIADRSAQSIVTTNLVTGSSEVWVDAASWPGNPPSRLSAIAWDVDEIFDGGLYIADSATAADQDAVIYHYGSLSGVIVFTEAPGPGLDTISALMFSPTAEPTGLFVAGNSNGDLTDWGVYDAEGAGEPFSAVTGIAGMAFDRAGDFGGGLFAARPSDSGFSGDGTVTPIDSEGLAGTPLIGDVSGIHAIVMAPPGPFEGRLLAADWTEQTVLAISPDGEVETIASGLALTPEASNVLAISPDGNVLMVAEPSLGRVVCVEPVP